MKNTQDRQQCFLTRIVLRVSLLGFAVFIAPRITRNTEHSRIVSCPFPVAISAPIQNSITNVNNLDNINNSNSASSYYYYQLVKEYKQCFDFIQKVELNANLSSNYAHYLIEKASCTAKQLQVILSHISTHKQFQINLEYYPSFETVANNEYLFATGKQISIEFMSNNAILLRGGGNKASNPAKKPLSFTQRQDSSSAVDRPVRMRRSYFGSPFSKATRRQL